MEERDASPTQRQIKEINSGIYAFDLAPLFDALRGIASQNAQGEFYLTDSSRSIAAESCRWKRFSSKTHRKFGALTAAQSWRK